MEQYFNYTNLEINYLKDKDKTLASVIEDIGFIKRKINPNVFEAIIENIIGQQISNTAAQTIIKRFVDFFGDITPQNLDNASSLEIKSLGISYRKVEYIKGIVAAFNDNKLNISKYNTMSDYDIIEELVMLKGVGQWSAEMVLIFSLNRMNVFSYNDLGIKRGLMKIYNLEHLDKHIFQKYQERFSPYCTIASFYLWEVANQKHIISK